MGAKCFLALVLLALPLGGASDGPLDRATLRGVAAVNVVIDPIPQDVEKEGPTDSKMRARIEAKLRDAGIRIDPASHEFVALRLSAVRAARGRLNLSNPFAIAATISFYQPVTLVRDPQVHTATQTWEVATVVLAGAAEVERACLDTADELAARFVSAYRSVNPAGDNAADRGH